MFLEHVCHSLIEQQSVKILGEEICGLYRRRFQRLSFPILSCVLQFFRASSELTRHTHISTTSGMHSNTKVHQPPQSGLASLVNNRKKKCSNPAFCKRTSAFSEYCSIGKGSGYARLYHASYVSWGASLKAPWSYVYYKLGSAIFWCDPCVFGCTF